jgi:hypothetical protein
MGCLVEIGLPDLGQKDLNHGCHGYTRIKQKSREELGQVKLALSFQIPSQASLRGIVKTHRSLAPRAALLFRALREMIGMGKGKDTGLRLARQAGRCFGKASEGSLASVFSKQLRHSCNESTLGFLGKKLVRPYPC